MRRSVVKAGDEVWYWCQASPEERFAEAERRISACAAANAQELDLSYLQLQTLPPAIASLTQLTSLDLAGNEIGPEGAKHLAGLTQLTSLDLRYNNHIGPEGAAHLAGLTQLTSLDLGRSKIGPEGAKHLAGLTKLTSLNLWDNKIGPEGAKHLAGLTQLTSLDLGWNDIGAEGAKHLARLTKLTRLDLWDNKIGPEGAKHLAGLTQLKALKLSANQIGPEGAKHLAGLTALQDLGLASTGIADLRPLLALTRLKIIQLASDSFVDPCPEFWRLASLEKAIVENCQLGDVPPQILSMKYDDNWLPPLRAYFDNLDKGPAKKLRDVKVMILGNGQIGKTQFRRRLMQEPYDDSVSSTHGVQIAETELPGREGGEATPLKIWDFGGQDIYLGTHALFMRTRAVFPILWTPTAEQAKGHSALGHDSKNYPLEEWVRYVASLAGTDSPVMILQTQCDTAEHEAPEAPLSPELRKTFKYPLKDFAFSAKEDYGLDTVKGRLTDAIRWLIANRQMWKIGSGWAAVKEAIEAMQRADRARAQAERQDRTMTVAAFNALCTKNGIADPAHAPILLKFLHDLGVLLFDERTFGDRIILDQQWALDAIYSVFDRARGALSKIKARKGRFTRSDLGYWVWNAQGFTEQDQEGFLALMLSSAICFPLRKETEGAGETLCIAPDLLPERHEVPRILDGIWSEDERQVEARVSYVVLPPGLLRTLMAEIGWKAGQVGLYWQEGFSFFDQNTQSRAWIEAERPDAHGWAGTLRIRTQHGQKELLLRRLCDVVLEESGRFGLKPTITEQDGARMAVADDLGPMDGPDDPRGSAVARANRASDSAPRGPAVLLKPGPEPLTKPGCFISYARTNPGEDDDAGRARREAFVAVKTRLEALGIAPLFDEQELAYGESITKFMKQMAGSAQTTLVVSKKYLHSPFCMFELLHVFRYWRSDKDEFRKHVRSVILPDAREFLDVRNPGMQKYWLEQKEVLSGQVETYAKLRTKVPDSLHEDHKAVCDFAHEAADLLGLVADTKKVSSIGEIAQLTFG